MDKDNRGKSFMGRVLYKKPLKESCIWWDNGAFNGELFGLLDRNKENGDILR